MQKLVWPPPLLYSQFVHFHSTLSGSSQEKMRYFKKIHFGVVFHIPSSTLFIVQTHLRKKKFGDPRTHH